MNWSSDERYFFYLAERKPAKTKSFFDQKPSKPDDGVVPGNEYKYVEDWGEQLTGYSKTVLAVFDVEEQNIKLVTFDGGEDRNITKVIPDTQNPNVLYMVLHHTDPFRLGLIYCTQRRSDLVRIEGWKDETPKITAMSKKDDDIAILDATISPKGDRLVWLQCPEGGPHNRAFEMWSCSVNDAENTRTKIISTSSMPLFFESQLVFQNECWLNECTIAFQCVTKSRVFVRTVDIDKSMVSEINATSPSNPNASHFLLHARQGDLLILETSFSMGPTVIFAKKSGDNSFNFTRSNPFISDSKFLMSEIECQLISTSFEKYDMEYFLAYPKNVENGKKVPLVVIPHGGPHSVFVSTFLDNCAGMVLCGYAVILVNYPGSLGFDSCNDLPGKVGVLDVQSCQQAAVEALAKFNDKLDKENVSVFGGSHGGFLALRLIADYPDFYKACITRNPVCDFAQMVGISDIPDWVFVECGLQPSLHGLEIIHDITKAEVLAKFNEQSPARFCDKVKCPVMMMVGSNDRRVPMSQGLNYCRMLKQSRPEVPVEIFQYEDNHSLNTVKVHSDVFVNAILWLEKFRKY